MRVAADFASDCDIFIVKFGWSLPKIDANIRKIFIKELAHTIMGAQSVGMAVFD